MARITKGMIQAALFNLDGIHELASDPHAFQGKHATYLYHTRSAQNYIKTLNDAGAPPAARDYLRQILARALSRAAECDELREQVQLLENDNRLAHAALDAFEGTL